MASEIFHELHEKAFRAEHRLLVHVVPLIDTFPGKQLSELAELAEDLYQSNVEFDDSVDRLVTRYAWPQMREAIMRCPVCGDPHCSEALLFGRAKLPRVPKPPASGK